MKNDKNEEDNVQYFKIIDIQKNEHFGDILMNLYSVFYLNMNPNRKLFLLNN